MRKTRNDYNTEIFNMLDTTYYTNISLEDIDKAKDSDDIETLLDEHNSFYSLFNDVESAIKYLLNYSNENGVDGIEEGILQMHDNGIYEYDSITIANTLKTHENKEYFYSIASDIDVLLEERDELE